MTRLPSLHKPFGRLGSAAIFICIASLASPSQARMSNPELNSLGAACWNLQSQNDKLMAEYKNASNERREELLQQIRNNGRTWRQIGCQGAYGDISRIVLTHGGLRNGITWDLLTQGESGGTTGGTVTPADNGAATEDKVFLY
jgi:hypothetical protein